MALTYLRLVLLPVFLFILIADSNPDSNRHRWLAAGVFAVMSLTDLLDGYLARRLGQTSRLGMILDPIADKILITCSVIVLSFPSLAPRGYALPWFVVAAVLLKDLTVVIGIFILLPVIRKIGTAPRILGKAATLMQLCMLLVILIAPDLDRLADGLGWWATRIFWGTATVVTVAAFADYLIEGIRLVPDRRGQRVEG
jgi:CDP-diacylglycerol--glycerol-3-phosphate 3-phosphatidyltransferase